MTGVSRDGMDNFIDTDAAPSTSNGSYMYNPAVFWAMMLYANAAADLSSYYTVVIDAWVTVKGNKK